MLICIFFLSFFYSAMIPDIELGLYWPSYYIHKVDPLIIPLTNTIILLTSGITITWFHHTFSLRNLKDTKISLTITVLLGLTFLILQKYEYSNLPFTINDSIYRSIFYLLTGCHRLHVTIRIILLIIILIRINLKIITIKETPMLDFSIW